MKQLITKVLEQHDPAMRRALATEKNRAWIRPKHGDHSLYQEVISLNNEKNFENKLPLRASAVLIPIIKRNNNYSILLTKRSSKLKNHSGQICFPGGGCEVDDLNAMSTALREAKEEINLPSTHIEVVGAMEDYETVTGFSISPVVGFVNPNFYAIPAKEEVEEIFEVSLDFILDERNHLIESMVWKGAMRQFYTFSHNKHKIWGATASILVRFAKMVNEYE